MGDHPRHFDVRLNS